MARPRSDEKRQAILDAAAIAIAEEGLGASTSRIARLAKVADGSLFTYFPTKDVLLNQLYVETKLGLAKTIMQAFPSSEPAKMQIRHVWLTLVNWGAANPALNQTIKQLKVSERITAETRAQVENAYAEICNLFFAQFARGPLRDTPEAYGMAIMSSVAETTMEFIARDPDNTEKYLSAGFEVLWCAIAE